MQLYHLGDADLLHEDWPENLETTGLLDHGGWGAPRWGLPGRSLEQEGLNEDILLRDYMIIPRAASRPPYAKCLTIAGVCHALQLPEFANTPLRGHRHAETSLPTLHLGPPQYEALPLTAMVFPDYRKTFLSLKMPYSSRFYKKMWKGHVYLTKNEKNAPLQQISPSYENKRIAKTCQRGSRR